LSASLSRSAPSVLVWGLASAQKSISEQVWAKSDAVPSLPAISSGLWGDKERWVFVWPRLLQDFRAAFIYI
jgi:hypothetical protein